MDTVSSISNYKRYQKKSRCNSHSKRNNFEPKLENTDESVNKSNDKMDIDEFHLIHQ